MTTRVEAADGPLMSIAAVQRDSGLSKDTLRVWERRYGFPAPLRDEHDERLYPSAQVAKLILLRRLIDAGHRPGKIVDLSAEELAGLMWDLGREPQGVSPEAREVLKRLEAYDAERLRGFLAGLVVRSGLRAFATEIGPALAEAVGAAWSRGELEIHQEHLFTEQFIAVLRSAISAVLGAATSRAHPRVLLGTFPQEPHALGLLMAETMFVLEGCACVSLGVQTPVSEIAAAARAHGADILALSFSAIVPASQAQSGLAELRAIAPKRAEIWAGGACAGLRPQPGVLVFRSLSDIGPAVAAWRSRNSGAGAPA